MDSPWGAIASASPSPNELTIHWPPPANDRSLGRSAACGAFKRTCAGCSSVSQVGRERGREEREHDPRQGDEALSGSFGIDLVDGVFHAVVRKVRVDVDIDV